MGQLDARLFRIQESYGCNAGSSPVTLTNAQVPEWLMGLPAKQLFVGSIPTLRSGRHRPIDKRVGLRERPHIPVWRKWRTCATVNREFWVRILVPEPMVLRC